jgi:glycosyltransferase involved in cell wall biosynthesis
MGDGPVARTTVVVPVWDEYVAQRLPDAVRSVLEQDVSVNLVVVDNASQVAIPPLPGISTTKSSTRLTLGAARNLGLAQVSTPYVIFWDADDIMLPGTLAALEGAIGEDPSVIAFGQAIVQDPGGGRYRWPRRWIKPLTRWPTTFAALNCVWSMYPATGATIMRSEVVRAAGGYPDEDVGEDWCLAVSLAFRGRLGWSERPDRLYRVYGDSLSHRDGGVKDLRRRTRAVRARVSHDSATPAWVRRCLPAIWLAQYGAIAGQQLVASARRRRVQTPS